MEEAAGKSGVSQVPARAGEKAVGSKTLYLTNIATAARNMKETTSGSRLAVIAALLLGKRRSPYNCDVAMPQWAFRLSLVSQLARFIAYNPEFPVIQCLEPAPRGAAALSDEV